MNIIIYTVKPGDSLYKIAKDHGTTVNDLARLNGIAFPNDIYAGQSIKIPLQKDMPSKWYVVNAGDTLYYIAQQFGTTIDALVENNNITDPNLIYPGQILRIM